MNKYNKAIKFVPAVGLHRTPLSGRRLLLALKSEGSFVQITPEILSTIGLALDLVGALMIGFEFFRKYEGDKFRPDAGLAVDPKKGVIQQSEVQPTDEYAKWEGRREKVAKFGLSILCLGFILQIVSNWI